jgi:hypothetical protein
MSARQSDGEPLHGMKRFIASYAVTPDDPEVERLSISGICMAQGRR